MCVRQLDMDTQATIKQQSTTTHDNDPTVVFFGLGSCGAVWLD
jgi:outer membrane protein W